MIKFSMPLALDTILQVALLSNEYTEGAWAGVGRTRYGSASGSSYNEWEFYDGTKLDQSGCYDKECSSGNGKYKSLAFWYTFDLIFATREY